MRVFAPALVAGSLLLSPAAEAVDCTDDAAWLIESSGAKEAFDQNFWDAFGTSFADRFEPAGDGAVAPLAVAFWQPKMGPEVDAFWDEVVEPDVTQWWVDQIGCKPLKRLRKVDPAVPAEDLDRKDQEVVATMLGSMLDFASYVRERAPQWAIGLTPRLAPIAHAHGPAFVEAMALQGYVPIRTGRPAVN